MHRTGSTVAWSGETRSTTQASQSKSSAAVSAPIIAASLGVEAAARRRPRFENAAARISDSFGAFACRGEAITRLVFLGPKLTEDAIARKDRLSKIILGERAFLGAWGKDPVARRAPNEVFANVSFVPSTIRAPSPVQPSR